MTLDTQIWYNIQDLLHQRVCAHVDPYLKNVLRYWMSDHSRVCYIALIPVS